jgi:hypothetical protein
MKLSTVIIVVFLCVIVFIAGYSVLQNRYTIPTIQPPTLPQPPPPSIIPMKTNPITKSYPYTLRGNSGSVSIILYTGILKEIEKEGKPVNCWRYPPDNTPCNYDENLTYYNSFIDERDQQEALDDIVNKIRNISSVNDDQVRIAISLVQNIPYDNQKAIYNSEQYYPYQTMYYQSGVCQDKSLLLAALLKHLGYGSELFAFVPENHMAVGVLSNNKLYGYHNGDYAFIETDKPTIITDSNGFYSDSNEPITYSFFPYGNKLTSIPIEYKISEGISMTSLREEYNDAKTYKSITDMGSELSSYYFDELYDLYTKYGIDTSYLHGDTKGSENIRLSHTNQDVQSGHCVISQNGVCVS